MMCKTIALYFFMYISIMNGDCKFVSSGLCGLKMTQKSMIQMHV